jgi:hypothetical protein
MIFSGDGQGRHLINSLITGGRGSVCAERYGALAHGEENGMLNYARL